MEPQGWQIQHIAWLQHGDMYVKTTVILKKGRSQSDLALCMGRMYKRIRFQYRSSSGWCHVKGFCPTYLSVDVVVGIVMARCDHCIVPHPYID